MKATQQNKLISIETPLGKDVLLLTGFKGTESISRCFEFHLTMISEDHNISFKDIIGESVTIHIERGNGEVRYISGIVSKFEQGRGGGESGEQPLFSYYTATLVPWLWPLIKTSNSRIFQEKSVVDIVEQIFKDNKMMDFKWKLQSESKYKKRVYCVQYGESDFNFISRLLEEEGICYFFDHEEGQHTMVLTDTSDENKPCPFQETARFFMGKGSALKKEVIKELSKSLQMTPTKYTVNDYNFETPNSSLMVETATNQNEMMAKGEREIYDYPGCFCEYDHGDRYGKLRMEEQEVRLTSIHGKSNCKGFIPGYRFTLTDYYREDLNDTDYVLMSVYHESKQGYELTGDADKVVYFNRFACIPFEIPYRPLRQTPKPVVQGVQTAFVVGPSGEEIYPDEYGRVKVQFHWDREGEKDEKSSCWIRVGQSWAGTGWGAMFIPRIGQEVIVEFIEGDPDRPIITGSVYHGNNMPPYKLPDDKTKSTLKSDSTKGGGGFNEFRFEDKKGEEEVYLHGQKDWTIAIENDKNQTIGNDETMSVGNDRTKDVGNDQSESIGNNKTISVGKNHSEDIGNDASVTVGKNETRSVGEKLVLSVGKSRSEDIGENDSKTVAKNKTVDVGENMTATIGKDTKVQTGKKMLISSGDDFGLSVDKKGTITVTDQLTIKVGKASITLKKNGDVSISGGKLNLKASGDVNIKGSNVKEN